MMAALLFGLSAGIGYLVTKLVDLATNPDPTKFLGARRSLGWFESFTLLLAMATFVLAALNFRNFGKGLKEHRLNHKRRFIASSSTVSSIGSNQRWEID